jgi:hypothetical protein
MSGSVRYGVARALRRDRARAKGSLPGIDWSWSRQVSTRAAEVCRDRERVSRSRVGPTARVCNHATRGSDATRFSCGCAVSACIEGVEPTRRCTLPTRWPLRGDVRYLLAATPSCSATGVHELPFLVERFHFHEVGQRDWSVDCTYSGGLYTGLAAPSARGLVRRVCSRRERGLWWL